MRSVRTVSLAKAWIIVAQLCAVYCKAGLFARYPGAGILCCTSVHDQLALGTPLARWKCHHSLHRHYPRLVKERVALWCSWLNARWMCACASHRTTAAWSASPRWSVNYKGMDRSPFKNYLASSKRTAGTSTATSSQPKKGDWKLMQHNHTATAQAEVLE